MLGDSCGEHGWGWAARGAQVGQLPCCMRPSTRSSLAQQTQQQRTQQPSDNCLPLSLSSATTSKSYSVSSSVGCCSYMLSPLEVDSRPDRVSCDRDTTDCMATTRRTRGQTRAPAREPLPRALALARAGRRISNAPSAGRARMLVRRCIYVSQGHYHCSEAFRAMVHGKPFQSAVKICSCVSVRFCKRLSVL